MTTSSQPLPVHAAYLLLAHDPATGQALVDDTHLKPGLAGAALLELTRIGALRVEGEGKATRLIATGGHVPSELTEAIERADGRSPKDAVARIGGASSFSDRIGRLRDATWRGLEGAGTVRPQAHKVLGLFPTTRWIQLRGERTRLVTDLRAALDTAGPVVTRRRPPAHGMAHPHDVVPALASVAQAAGVLRKVFPDIPRKELEARSAALVGDLWGGPAVAKAISDIQAGIVAATVATSAAVIGGSS